MPDNDFVPFLIRCSGMPEPFDNEKSVQTEQLLNSVFLLSVFSLWVIIPD